MLTDVLVVPMTGVPGDRLPSGMVDVARVMLKLCSTVTETVCPEELDVAASASCAKNKFPFGKAKKPTAYAMPTIAATKTNENNF